MQQIKKITQPFPEIIVAKERWKCPGIPDQILQILQDLTKASMDISLQVKKEHFTSNSFWDIKA